MSYEFITVEKEEHLTIVTINRPERMNALHPPAQLEMNDAWNDFAEDSNAWVAILTGAGDKAFSAGNDLKFQAEFGGAEVRKMREKATGGFGGLHRRLDCFKPMIAAVNGFALGGGFEMALSCDIILAAEHARFGLPEPRVGLMAAAGGVHRLPRQIPYHRAMGMMLANRQIGADEAFNLGLINEVVPADSLLSAARTWADDILQASPLAIQATKEAATRGLDMPLGHGMDSMFPKTAKLFASEDFVEGPKAFAEKRKPNWKGE